MKKAIFALAILLVSNIPSIYYGWYLKVAWFDVGQHFLGGFFVAMLMSYYLADRLVIKNQSTNDVSALVKNALIVVGATVFIGVVWEFAEYIGNQTLAEPLHRWTGIKAYFMGDLNDTVMDLMLDTLGALSYLAISFLPNPRKQL